MPVYSKSKGPSRLPTCQTVTSFDASAPKNPRQLPVQSVVVTPQLSTVESIFIPQGARGQLISNFPVSVRLQHIFEYKRFRFLGDIQGISYAEFSKFRNCGKKTVAELRELVRTIQRTQPDAQLGAASQSNSAPFVPLVGDSLFVPASVRDLKFGLPISVRLEGVMGRKRLIQLGDLHGISVNELKGIGNCGKATIAEIVRLIEKAAAGEFKTVTETNVGCRRRPAGKSKRHCQSQRTCGTSHPSPSGAAADRT